MTDYNQHKIMVRLLIHVLTSGELAQNAAESRQLMVQCDTELEKE